MAAGAVSAVHCVCEVFYLYVIDALVKFIVARKSDTAAASALPSEEGEGWALCTRTPTADAARDRSASDYASLADA